MYDFLIVGAGLFGAVFAHEATKRGKKCLVIEKRNRVGGNIYTEVGRYRMQTDGADIFFDHIFQFDPHFSGIKFPAAAPEISGGTAGGRGAELFQTDHFQSS